MKAVRMVGFSLLLLCSGLTHALSIHHAQRQVPWPEGRIPFLITERVNGSAALEQNLREAIAEWNAVGAQGDLIRFFEITPAQVAQYPEHLDVRLRREHGQTECGALVSTARGNVAPAGHSSGFPGSGIRTTLTLYVEGCGARTSAHELGHVLGFLHEHQRKDANIVINSCNHAKAREGTTNEACEGLTLNLWKLSVQGSNLNSYISEYDPFSVMHYDLQSNLKPELAGPIDPVTGNYTTLDFNRVSTLKNNLDELGERFGLSAAEIYDRMQHPPTLLSDIDKSAARALYARNSTDVQVSMAKTCFAKSKADKACLVVGDFIVTMTISNFGAWPAADVPLSLSFPGNVEMGSLRLDTDENCGINNGSRTLDCELAALEPNGNVQIVLSGKVSDPGTATTLVANVTPPASQNGLLLNEGQYTSNVKFGGSLGALTSLVLLGLGLGRRTRRRTER